MNTHDTESTSIFVIGLILTVVVILASYCSFYLFGTITSLGILSLLLCFLGLEALALAIYFDHDKLLALALFFLGLTSGLTPLIVFFPDIKVLFAVLIMFLLIAAIFTIAVRIKTRKA